MTFQHKEETFVNRFILNMLNLEITDNFKYRKSLITFIYWLTRTIENNLPRYICTKFFNTQQRLLQKLFIFEENRLLKRLVAEDCLRDRLLKRFLKKLAPYDQKYQQ